MKMTKKTKKIFNNQSGAALLMAMSVTVLLFFLISEVSYETIQEYLVVKSDTKRIQSYYAAEACEKMSLLRIKLYDQAVSLLEDKIPDTSMLNQIWQFPLPWPIVPPDSVNAVAKSELLALANDSLMKQQWAASIQSISAKLDISDLISPIETLREKTRMQLLRIFEQEIENNEKFANKYSNTDFNELINNIQDWMDSDTTSLNGGGESQYYDVELGDMPPNQPFKTLDELLLVEGMRTDFFKLIKNKITVHGTRAININYADAEMLTALHPDLSESPEVVEAIIERRNSAEQGGPFKDKEDFYNFISGDIDTAYLDENGVRLTFGPEFNFKINCFGINDNFSTEIVTQVFNLERLKFALVPVIKAELDKNKDEGEEEEASQAEQLFEECKDKLKPKDFKDCMCKDIQERADQIVCQSDTDKKFQLNKTDPNEHKWEKKTEKISEQKKTYKPLPGPPSVISRTVK